MCVRLAYAPLYLLNGLTEYMQEKESFSRLFSHLKRMNT